MTAATDFRSFKDLRSGRDSALLFERSGMEKPAFSECIFEAENALEM